jgi:hypothetical protein
MISATGNNHEIGIQRAFRQFLFIDEAPAARFLDVVCVNIMRILERCRYCTLVP